MKLLLIVNGEKVKINFSEFDQIVAVDGGLEHLHSNIIPNLIIGDFDSIDNDKLLKFKNKTTIIYKDNQNETDLQFAINYCLKQQPSEITIIGAVSIDRIDHVVSNLLTLRQIPKEIKVKIVTSMQEIFLLRNEKVTLFNCKNKTISIFSVSECKKVKTSGLKWKIDKDLDFGFIGISNIATSDNVKISVEKGELLVFLERSK